jgi:hypothetical protein
VTSELVEHAQPRAHKAFDALARALVTTTTLHRLVVLLVAVLVGAACSAEAPTSSPVAAAGSPLVSTPASAPPAPATPTPTASAQASASPGATAATADAYRWEQVATVDRAPDRFGDWRLLAGSVLGYVSLTRSPAAAWFSADGISWAEHRLTVPRGTMLGAQAVAASGDGFVVVGRYSPCSRRDYERNPFFQCRPRPVSHASTDGRVWRASQPWEGSVGEPGRLGSVFYAVWPVPTGGWDAAQALDPSDESDDFEFAGPAIWHSPDGLAWTNSKAFPDAETECVNDFAASELHGAADTIGRRIAAAGESGGCGEAWLSPDGRTWTAVPGFEGPAPGPVVSVGLPGDGLRPWRLLGYALDEGSDSTGATVWESTDLTTWDLAELPGATEDGLVLTASRGPSTDVAVGWGAGRSSQTWVSEGAGPWSGLGASPPAIEAVGWGPVGAVGLVGRWNTAGHAVTGFDAWRLTPVTP